MEDKRQRLLHGLSREEFRTGTQMGAALGMSRAAVHKHIQALVERGVPVHRVPGRGYRLGDGVTLLDEPRIVDGLSGEARSLLSGVKIMDEVDSTSAYLASLPAGRPLDGRVCLAESQTAGRGRRGRGWVATPYRDLMMSVGVEYPQWPAQLQTLGLATALQIVLALEELVPGPLMVKWPNDVIHGAAKLCGILLDVSAEAHGSCRVLVGIGINVSMAPELGRAIDRDWTDLETLRGSAPDRNAVAAACLNRLLPAFRAFPRVGFAGHREAWRRFDALMGRAVVVHVTDGGVVCGRADGVDDAGRLRVVDDSGRTRLFTQGEVSVRAR